ncbi:MAG: BACON domain-containing protein [Tidjanibacter sp.]|nr:BACON domain-containing protein [Tidjanibacter sp.]
MKRYLLILLSFVALFGCKDPEQPVPELTLTSESVMNFGAEASSGTISYTLKNPVAGTQIATSVSHNWVSEFDTSKDGTVQFAVAANPNTEQRSAIITVAYASEVIEVAVNQSGAQPAPEPEDVEFTATALSGLYNGYYLGYYTSPNYYFYLSDRSVEGMESNEATLAPNGTYYLIDLFTSEEPTEEPITIAEGVYTYDDSGDNLAGTFTAYSRHFKTNSTGEEVGNVTFTDGTLTVTADGMTLVVTDTDGITHTVTYSGSYEFYNASGDEIGSGPIDPDIAVEYESPNAFIRYIEDGIFYLTLGPNDFLTDGSTAAPSARYYFFSLITDVMEEPTDVKSWEPLPKGTYTIDLTDSGEPWTIDATDRSMYVHNNASGTTIDADYFSEGTVEITDEGITATIKTTTRKQWHKVTYTFPESEPSPVTAYYYGNDYDDEDFFPGAVTDYEIELDFSEEGYRIMLGMLSDQPVGATALPTGEFAVEYPVEGEPFSGTVIRGGETLMDTYLFPSYVVYYDAEGEISDYMIADSGNVTICKCEEGYSFDIELSGTLLSDESEASLTYTWSGKVAFEDVYGPDSVPAQPTARKSVTTY